MMPSSSGIGVKLVHLCLVDVRVKSHKAFGKRCNSIPPEHMAFLSFHLVGKIEQGNRVLREKNENLNI